MAKNNQPNEEHTIDPLTWATVAAGLMPRIELPSGWERKAPKFLREKFDEAHAWWLDGGDLPGHNGSTPLDVVMEEALKRAHLLLRRAHGLPSFTQKNWSKNITEAWATQDRVFPEIQSSLKKAKYPLTWQDFTKAVLPSSTDKVRRLCWREFLAKSELGIEDKENRVVWESEANLTDREDPGCKILPESKGDLKIKKRGAYRLAVGLYEYYQENSERIRQKSARRTGAAGGRKSQRLRRKDDARGDIV